MRRNKNSEYTYYKAISGSSVRAKYQASPAIHTIEFTFITESGDTIKVEMEHDKAAEVIESAMHAYGAIQRPLRQAYKNPFG